MEGQPERHCRICMAERGPGGLADALVEPCGCRGTAAWAHLSCLHEWRVQKARQLRDASRCEVCGEPYSVPARVWQTYAAAAGDRAGWQLSLVAAWEAARPALASVGRLARLAVRLWLAERYLRLWLNHAGFVAVDQQMLPPPTAAAAGTCTARLRLYVARTLCWSLTHMLLDRSQGRYARMLVATAGSWATVAATARLQRACAVPWDAPGAPAKEPAVAVAAAVVHRLAVVLAALTSSWVPSQWHMLLQLLPGLGGSSLLRGLDQVSADGYRLLQAGARQADEDRERAALAGHVQRLFAARPAALLALQAVAEGRWWSAGYLRLYSWLSSALSLSLPRQYLSCP